ncbi:MAG: slipin family protein [Chloroflexi bacterium]|nr:slipin family protein [Chloroflexota bacterium]
MLGGVGLLLCLGGLFFIGLMYIFSAIRVIPEYERGVIFRLGRLVGARGPGLFFVWPPIERMIRIDTRVLTMDVPAQEIITLDNVTIKVNAVLYFMVIDPNKAVVNVMDYVRATMQIAQTTVRSVMGKVELDTILADRARLNSEIQQIIDEQTEPWGVKVTIVEVKDVELPQQMQRAMARQAEAEREKRAKIIHAEGEFQASKQLANAADIIANEPVTLQLRYLQTLTEIATEKNSTILFPFPIDIVRPFLGMLGTSEEMELRKAAMQQTSAARQPQRQPAQIPPAQAVPPTQIPPAQAVRPTQPTQPPYTQPQSTQQLQTPGQPQQRPEGGQPPRQ